MQMFCVDACDYPCRIVVCGVINPSICWCTNLQQGLKLRYKRLQHVRLQLSYDVHATTRWRNRQPEVTSRKVGDLERYVRVDGRVAAGEGGVDVGVVVRGPDHRLVPVLTHAAAILGRGDDDVRARLQGRCESRKDDGQLADDKQQYQ